MTDEVFRTAEDVGPYRKWDVEVVKRHERVRKQHGALFSREELLRSKVRRSLETCFDQSRSETRPLQETECNEAVVNTSGGTRQRLRGTDRRGSEAA